MVKFKFISRLREKGLKRKSERAEFQKEIKKIRMEEKLSSEKKRLKAISERKLRGIRFPKISQSKPKLPQQPKPIKRFVQPQRKTLSQELDFLKNL